MRILLTVEYDGTNYSGWQRQKNAISVQQVLEEAIETATGTATVVVGAGRTDAGVHAFAQCAHFDTKTSIPPDKIAYALNLVLPRDIRIRESRKVSDHFHARKSARGKHYRYVIYQAPHDCAINRDFCCHIRYGLNVEAMRQAAAYLKGTHDFASFCAAGSSVESTVRKISDLDIQQIGEHIYIDVKGNGFLYNMVRIIVGTLLEVGSGRRSALSVAQILQAKSRDAAGPTAPAKGLFLICVAYDHNLLLK